MRTTNILAYSITAVAFAIVASSLLSSSSAFAFFDDFSNSASQSIDQDQSLSQNSQVVSGGSTTLSGNNIGVQLDLNTGNNVLAQSNP